MAPEHPFFLLLRSRRAFYRRQSFALYLRYAHVLAVLLALTGPALAERPALLAEPILHFWRGRADPLSHAGWAFVWLACVYLWVRVHRAFIAGGALAGFVRSLPGAVRAAAYVDTAMLLVSLQVFLVPAGLAAWTVAHGGGAGASFAGQAALLAVLTFGAARLAVGGVGRIAGVVLCAGFVLLCAVSTPLATLPMTVLASAALRMPAGARPVLQAHKPWQDGAGTPGPGAMFLLRLQCIVLARRHLHAALPRLALACAIMAASLWMIFGVGKLAESDAFVKVACWLAIAVMSGFYYLFWTARQPIQPFLASLPRGVQRMALSEQLLVVGATGVLFAGAWAACLLRDAEGAPVAAQVVRHGAAALAVLPLLGLPFMQRHQDGVLIKVAVLAASFLLL